MSNTLTKKADMSACWQLAFAMVLVALVVVAPDFAAATGVDNKLGNVFCTVTGWFTGNVGKGLATIGVTVIGIGALLGKVSWGMALIVGTGVAIVFGAASLVDTMGGGVTDASSNCKTNA